MMATTRGEGSIVPALDAATATLVRLAAVIAAGSEGAVRQALSLAARNGTVDPVWVEEVILQSYLFAGFPRTLNAAREWRKVSGRAAPPDDEGARVERVAEWRARGEATCATVYGPFYERLRHNIRELHPALDAWMIVEGYGKVLSREALDLRRRELCIVAVCAVAQQDRQLHSHLHGALNAVASPAEVEGALAAIADLIAPDDATRYRLLWARVRGSAAQARH
jgi:4-carboxymuconolactone decarboxylase